MLLKYGYRICKTTESAQACVTAVLTTHNDTGDDSVLDNILNCPCMERCFNGAPCRTKGDYIDFAKERFSIDNHKAMHYSG